MVQVHGRLTEAGNNQAIEIKIKPTTHTIVNVLIGLTLTTILTWKYNNDPFTGIVLATFLILQILFILLDLNSTDQQFMQYLESFKNGPSGDSASA